MTPDTQQDLQLVGRLISTSVSALPIGQVHDAIKAWERIVAALTPKPPAESTPPGTPP